jgi:hypothetical protein
MRRAINGGLDAAGGQVTGKSGTKRLPGCSIGRRRRYWTAVGFRTKKPLKRFVPGFLPQNHISYFFKIWSG